MVLKLIASSGGTQAAVDVRTHGALGNGTADDTGSFHAARDAAGIAGRVYVPAGTYVVNNLTLSTARQTWELAPGAVVKHKAASTTRCVNITGAGVVLRGGKVDGDKANQTSNNCFGIGVSAADVTVTGVEVANCYSHGIALSDTALANRALIESNSCHDNGVATNGVSGIYHGDGTTNARILNNACYNNGTVGDPVAYDGNGIHLYSTAAMMNVQVSGNQCNSNARRGIKVQGPGFNVTGNTCSNNSDAGIGVTCDAGTTPRLHSVGTVSSNILVSNNRGLQLDNCADITVVGNHAADSTDYGLLANAGAVRITMVGNTVERSGRHGFNLNGILDWTITGNTAIDNGQAGVNRYGFVLQADGATQCSRVLLSGNLSQNSGGVTTQSHGFVIVNNGDQIHLVGNIAKNVPSVDFSLSATLTNFTRSGNVGVSATSGGSANTDIFMAAGAALKGDATTGFKICDTASQKLGFYGAAPVIRPTATPAAATDAATTQTLVNDLRAKLIALGLIA